MTTPASLLSFLATTSRRLTAHPHPHLFPHTQLVHGSAKSGPSPLVPNAIIGERDVPSAAAVS